MKDDNIRAALFMMLGTGAYTINDVFLKLLGSELPMFQILFLRGLVVTLFFGVLLWQVRDQMTGLARKDMGLVVLRSLAEAAAAYFFLHALFNMPLANLTAILQVIPLTVALAAFVVLKEPLGWRRMSAIMIGFCGVLLIVRPGAEGFTVYSLSALMSVAMITIRDLATRMLGRSMPSVMVAFTASCGVMLFGGLGSLTEIWAIPSALGWIWLLGATGFIIAGYYFVILAMRVGELTFAAPFRYAALLFALVAGWLVFDEWPDALTFIGSGIIVATGIYTLYREGKMRRIARLNAQAG
ncbi:DMT family transporter [Roseinatronobacter bogoriensis]|uniref:EamA/RhaT family transporter n=1 Tax=Roseinatronobacter bogoriensis subsp. barguzinensis TaxID=441209 RepID=A0A2K8K8A6_9RHOB|nr:MULTISPECIES: DMT family transporter [Rhodobaca]ATX65166.1 EamA/RhaT family transporter [Rhodobaca barguzinensis]MBB4209662.1 S-adenosylmethionine uptake transporter [Rhodobaca bogoriensis DSM 18756]TDW35347.1 S-adenosylmethionine uptake transporter [Rhodobaca barguzinensis]TDY66557.1 S-adenosylmethionine uptake transporter [Rhodobaca bogoriensis DSM 18756]